MSAADAPRTCRAPSACYHPLGPAQLTPLAHTGHPATPLPPARWAQLTPTQLLGVRRRACEAELLFSGKDSNKDEFVTAGGTPAPTTGPSLSPLLPPCCLRHIR